MTRRTSAPLVDLTQLGRPRRRLKPVRLPRPAPEPHAYALTRDDAGAYLGISGRMIGTLIADGRLRSFAVGSRRLIRRVDLEAFADAQCAAAGYHLMLPRTLNEARAAAAQAEAEADRLGRYGSYADGAAAFAQLARWFRIISGEIRDAEAA